MLTDVAVVSVRRSALGSAPLNVAMAAKIAGVVRKGPESGTDMQAMPPAT